ncbi:MAG: Hpt domain-containing protein, partial [Phormidesmis sp. CAN_BIN44]|nr:Hpt domain-containing protein [Phormidesmis sp. CAN_BIN44]
MRDYSMLDLFRQEVETQVKSLKQSLSILKEQPSQEGELDTAIRSLHAIAGSAQLIEIDVAATLSEKMRVRLIAVQNGSTLLTDALVDRLLHAGDLLIEISDATSDGTLENWLLQHSDDLVQTQAAIVEANVAPISSPIPQKRVNSPEKLDLTPSDDAKPNPPSLLLDSSMMELFRLEVEAQATLLNNGLLALESQSHSAQELEALMRAAHSVKGAARIVGLDAAVQLAHVMEDCFVAAQDRTITLNSDRADVLLRGVDLLQSLSQVSDADLPNWLANHDSEFKTVRSTIEAIRNAEGTAAIQTLKADFVPAIAPA